MSYILNAKNNVLKNKDEKVTSDYGNRSITVNGKKDTSFHNGIDLVSKSTKQDYILAFEEGIVKSVKNSVSGFNTSNAAGNYIYIDHGNNYLTKYHHLKKDSIKVKKGQKVKKGDIIAYTGNTGYTTGVHLHFAVYKDNSSVNPKPYLLGDKKIKSTNTKYKLGRYRVNVNFLNVRKGAGTNYDKKVFSELSKNAQNQIIKLIGYKTNSLCRGVECDVSEIKGNWGKIPSGWIYLKYCEKI